MCLKVSIFTIPLSFSTLPLIPQCRDTILILRLLNSLSFCLFSSWGELHPTGLVAEKYSIGKSTDRDLGSKQLSFQKKTNVSYSLLGKAFV